MMISKSKLVCVFVLAAGLCGASASSLKLWYNSAGANGNLGQSLLLGNGRMGALVSGQVVGEQIYICDSTLWTGTANTSGNYDEPNPAGFGAYQYFGTLNITNNGQSSFANYYRDMDIGDAIAHVSYSVGTTNYYREYFCSHPDDVMVIRLTAGAPGAYSGTLNYKDAHSATPTYTSTNITAGATLPGSGIQWAVNVRIINSGGTLSANANGITYSGCDSLTIIISAGTSYVMDSTVNFIGTNPSNHIATLAASAAAKNYSSLTNAHMTDYHNLFNRVAINLGQSTPAQRANPIPTRISNRATTADPELDTLLFQNSRYLLIASSRTNGLPPNLQGMWTVVTNAPWGADYHTDINIQMCMWSALPGALPECDEPLMNFVNSQILVWRQRTSGLDSRMIPNGVPRGWTVRVSHNISGGMGWNWNPPGNAWYALHYWEHYQFTGDRNFLATNAYPLLKECCQFWQDTLTTNSTGQLWVPASWSPEHNPAYNPGTNGTSYAQELIWNLFNNYIQAGQILETDSVYRATISDLRDRLLKPKIGKWGQLQEWFTDIDSPTDNHRHTSHLISVFPADEITPNQTPALATAAKISLIARGETGDSSAEWANVWRTALWARFDDGEMAYHRLSLLFADHEVLNNFVMNLSPPQWDGTYGIAAGMIEMLLQSHEGEINLLPALPSAWPSGSVTGLRARGGFSVDLSWTNGWLTSATVHSITGTNCVVRYGDQIRQMTIPPGGSAQFNPLPPGTPAAPSNLSVTTITNTTLTWNSSDVGLCTYTIKYSTNYNGPYSTIATGVHGTYYITSLGATNYFVVYAVRNGIQSSSSAAASNLPLPPQAGTYQITDVPGYALEDQNGAGTNVDQRVYNDINQQWVIAPVTNNEYKIISAASGLALGGPNSEAQLVLQPYTGANSQLWTFQPDNSYYNVVNVETGQAMDDWSASGGAGTIVGQWPLSSGNYPNRDWTLLMLAPATGLPVTLSASLVNGQISLSFQGVSDGTYILESSTNLISGWTPVVTNILFGGKFNYTANNPTSPQRFYRIRQ